MISPSTGRTLTAGVVAALCLTASAEVHAQMDCSAVGGANAHRIFLTGSTAIKNLMTTVGNALAALPTPIYLIYYQQKGSCDGVHAMFDMGPPAPLAGTAVYYGGGAMPSCDFITPVAADVGISDVFPDSCDEFSEQHTLPTGVGDFSGPVQVMTFVVPKQSSRRVISRDAAYIVFGFGGNGTTVSPWTDHASIWQRTEASGTQSMIAKAIGVRSTQWLGNKVLTTAGALGGSGDIVRVVSAANSNAATAEKTIGILSTDIADAMGNRNDLVILAYQHTGQTCAYWPDSTVTTFDKVNVRDGHYPIWGAVHFLTHVGDDGKPSNPDVAAFIDYLRIESPSLDSVQAQVGAATIPQCAMKVKRSSEIGPYTPYKPSMPCGCYFEKQNGAGQGCVACSDTMPCAAGKVCSYGFCEDI